MPHHIQSSSTPAGCSRATRARGRRANRLMVASGVVLLSLVVASCASADDDTATPSPQPSATTAGDTSASPSAGSGATTSPGKPDASSAPTADLLDRVVEEARVDLEARLGPGDPIEVVAAKAETFPNGALGCPKEGKSYTQALVEGYRVTLGRGERVWLYTAGPDGKPRLCPSDEKDAGREFVPPPGFTE